MGLKYFNVKNGLTAGNIILDAGNNSIVATSFDGTTATFSGNLISNGISNLGVITNVIISGGSAGQSIVTDGAGNLSFATATSSMAPMPYQIDTGHSPSQSRRRRFREQGTWLHQDNGVHSSQVQLV